MVTPELQNYIKQARTQGIPDAQIRQNLLASGGWDENDLNQAFSGFQPLAPVYAVAGSAAKTSHTGLIVGVVTVVLALAGGGFFGYQYFKNKSSQSEVVFDEPSWETPNTAAPGNNVSENSTPLNDKESTPEEISGNISSDACLYESLREYPGAKKAEGSEEGAALAGGCGVIYYTSDSPTEVEKYYLIAPDGIKVGQFDEILGPYKMMYQSYNNQKNVAF